MAFITLKSVADQKEFYVNANYIVQVHASTTNGSILTTVTGPIQVAYSPVQIKQMLEKAGVTIDQQT